MEQRSSVDAVLGDGSLVALILACLHSSQDRHSASLVCRLWNDAIKWASTRISIRCRLSLDKLAPGFSHIATLDMAACSNQLRNDDLALAGACFSNLRNLRIGCLENPQELITEDGLKSIAQGCKMLECFSLSSVPNVGDEAIEVLSHRCKFINSMYFENCRSLTDSSLEALPRFGFLQNVVLKGHFKFTPAGLMNLGACKNLVKLSLDLGYMDLDVPLKAVALGCPNISDITLKFKNGHLRDLAKCSRLINLSLCTEQRASLDEALLNIVASNVGLQALVFINPYSPLNEGTVISIVMRCSQLKKLHLEAANLTDMSVLSITGCKELEFLALDHFKSSGEGMAQFGFYGLALRHFSLKAAKGIRDMDLQVFVHDKEKLEHLDLQCCSGPTAIGFSSIAACVGLSHLDLSFTEVDDLSLTQIARGVKHLKHLNLVKCEAICSALSVAHFTTLESLNLDQCSFITDEGLEILGHYCRLLRVISLAFTTITDLGLTHLANCSELRNLRIPYCRRVQGPGVVEIAESCKWFQFVVLSHRFRGSKTVAALEKRCCIVCLESDEMALVPFGVDFLL